MSKWMMVGLLGCSIATSVAGCNIENCEKGAFCGDGSSTGGDWDNNGEEHAQCLDYCDRLSVCGAPQAKDFDECVTACEDRFDRLPEEMGELCSCTPRSRCEDVVEGRCTPGSGGQGGSGGTSATGGSPGNGGNPSTGGSSNNGGSPETGGSSSTGGSWTTGGSSSTGGSPATGGTSHTGGSHSTGGSTTGGSGGTGGSDAGGAGGEEPGTPCTCSCQCLSGQSCVSGYCSG